MKKIFLISLLSCIGLFFIEQVLEVNYFIKTLVKIVLFIVVPILFINHYPYLKWSRVNKRVFLLTLVLSILGACLIFGVFEMLKSFIDPEAIISDLTTRLAIDKGTFIYVAVYISCINSFIEEFYFRGWIINKLKSSSRLGSYIYSSLLFSLYHIAIFFTWFHWSISLLAVIGLFFVGIIFCLINEKSNSVYTSWLIHASANIAIMVIGYTMF